MGRVVGERLSENSSGLMESSRRYPATLAANVVSWGLVLPGVNKRTKALDLAVKGRQLLIVGRIGGSQARQEMGA